MEVAVVEVDAESILNHGLGFATCDVLVLGSLSGLLRPSGDPVETVLLDALATGGTLILNSGDPAVHTLASRWTGSAVFVGDNASSEPSAPSPADDAMRAAAFAVTHLGYTLY